MNDSVPSGHGMAEPYRVLARKYRPATFAELIGQPALVRTLTNAIASGRLAHAFILTGVRGVGKTTTARIIARSLNCVSNDGKAGPTADPCGQCPHCTDIAADRHVDVMEMDAASRTGVDDIREIIDGVRYRPVSARFKVYIIDEVHMLSKQAFNALLKTLEEPPEHAKFVFATTEIRKVPVTVLSRCQRFDLRRVEHAVLSDHLAAIAGKERVTIAAEAIDMIARAADGSVRDGLSLLDQAIAHGGTEITGALVRDMLGLADRARIVDLYDSLMRGDVNAALAELRAVYDSGADPQVVVRDLLEVAHWLTRLKIDSESAEGPLLSDVERARAKEMAAALTMPVLARTWQMLLKGLGEVQAAPAPLAATEMVLIRIAYAANLPPPAELLRTIRREDPAGATAAEPQGGDRVPRPQGPAAAAVGAAGAQPATAPECAPLSDESRPGEVPRASAPAHDPRGYEDLVQLFNDQGKLILASHLMNNVHEVHFEPGRLEIRLNRFAPSNLPQQIGTLLSDWCGRRWVVSVSGSEGKPTLSEQANRREAERLDRANMHPLVRAVMEIFPDATVASVRELEMQSAAAIEDASGGDDGGDDE